MVMKEMIRSHSTIMKQQKNNVKMVLRMYHIFLCDDDIIFLNKLKEQVADFISKTGIQMKIFTFNAMEEISDQLLKKCDFAILDIDFAHKQYSGLDIAKRLRLFRKDAVIIFATNYIEFAPEGYEVQAFRYILKCEIPLKLEKYLHQATKQLLTNNESIKFQTNGEIIDISIKHILYIESQLHTVRVFVQAQEGKRIKEYSFYSSIGKLETFLSEKGFLRIHKSYLVNMAHIRRYQCQKVELNNGIELKASANRYSDQKEKYLLWKGQIFNG